MKCNRGAEPFAAADRRLIRAFHWFAAPGRGLLPGRLLSYMFGGGGGMDTRAALMVLEDLIREQGVVVAVARWDGGGMTNGSNWIYRFADVYWTHTDPDGFAGPFDALH